MNERVYIREVGLRDGLQLAGTILSTEQKLTWIETEAAAGVEEFEVTSFVPPESFPQFADAEKITTKALELRGLIPSVLAVNHRGVLRALETGVKNLNYVLSASDAHSQANVHATVEQAIEEFQGIVGLFRARGAAEKVHLCCAIATAFGCTLQGSVAEDRVLKIVAELQEAGADEIMLADTVGYANPAQVRRLFVAVSRITDKPISAHFHDTRGLGLANVVAAIEAGVRRFDASLAGLGGCPFAPGATGNVAMEDCVFLLESLGFDTRIDIERLIEVRRVVQPWLPGETFSGTIARAGLPKHFRQAVTT